MPEDKESKVSAAHAAASKAASSAERSSGPSSHETAPPRSAAPAAAVPTGNPTRFMVEGHPVQPAGAEPDPSGYTPYTAPSEIVQGGRYIRNARMRSGKLYGGEVADAHGNVLATFDDDAENTGNPDDGTKPDQK